MIKARVGFRYIDSRDWQGGFNYLLNLCRAVVNSDNNGIEPVVFCGIDPPLSDRERFEQLLGTDFVDSPVFDPVNMRKRLPGTLITGCDKAAEREFRNRQVDVVFENADYYGRSFGFPTIAWIPDFQHRRLPQMFSRMQFWKRELGFRAQFASSRQIMVSSNDAKLDCQEFYGLTEDRINIVRFAVPFERWPPRSESDQIIRKYELPEKFFFLPNQFWKHKNHDVVVDALHFLKQQGHEVVVAVSGGASGSANIEQFDRIKARVGATEIEKNFRLLGRIPYRDVMCLLFRCTALINPSRFEGWSTTIEEAKSLSVRMVLSNLSVHREQVPEGGEFFDASKSQELARILLSVQDENNDSAKDENTLRVRSESRMLRFVDEFANLVANCKRSAS